MIMMLVIMVMMVMLMIVLFVIVALVIMLLCMFVIAIADMLVGIIFYLWLKVASGGMFMLLLTGSIY
jgi:hypothetical protein